ncbi:Mic19 family protein [Aliiroseovarius sp. F47248L]|uniref:Mic19 family protein n=1 Tax=Aliiroseovarius sp. F47248L TaxID=2926420 RepID=UPI001FF55FDF|nr:Mic19 family protein [Aliiroseovarius sp. F47248L]MCK0138589.1 Mic19 family protein [Aliiroseovarius sp. F47248L]
MTTSALIRFRLQTVLGALVVSSFAQFAIADDTKICGSIAELKQIRQRVAEEGRPVDMNAIMRHLTTLQKQLEHVQTTNSNLDKQGAGDTLTSAVFVLRRMSVNSIADPVLASVAFEHDLSQLIQALQRVSPLFGCEANPQVPRDAVRKPLEPLRPDSSEKLSTSSVAVRPVIGIATAVFIATIVVTVGLFRWSLRSREPRTNCRTPFLFLAEDYCTISNFVDINRNGAKIEVGSEHVVGLRGEFFFCGHKATGRVMWRNTYFAGIQFKPKITQEMMDDVVVMSRTSIADSGLQNNATTCFHVGCHKTCPKHKATTFSKLQQKQ